MALVVDSSVTLAWCLSDESSEDADRVLDLAANGEALVVPSLWTLEVANVLLVAERRGRVTESGVGQALALLGQLGIDIRVTGAEPAALIALGRRHGLSAYDAAYLQLAISTGLALATFDRELATAARAAGVELFFS